MKKIILLILLSVQISAAQNDFNPRPINFNLTVDQWREDLRYFAEELPKRHNSVFRTMSREQFEIEIKKLNVEIPNLTGEQIFVRFLKLIGMVGDGHTSIESQSLVGLGIYPLRYEVLQDGLFIQSASADYDELVGGQVIKIGKTNIEEILPKLREVSSADNRNEQGLKLEMAFLLSSPVVLQGLKIAETDEKISVTVKKDGQSKTLEVKPIKDVKSYFREGKQINAFDKSANPLPLYLKNPNNKYWFEYLKDSKILYVQFNSIQNKSDESVAAFFKKVFDFAENNPVEKFVLDIRLNTGGENSLFKPIVIGLIKGKFNEHGKLFVITGRRTLSAAQSLLNEIEKYTDSIFVGEPTGASPNSYGNPIIMTLPNSKMPFRVATLYHQTNPTDIRVFTAPEIFTPLTSKDFQNNIDPAFQAITNYVPGSTFKDLTAEASKNADIAVFIKRYRTFKSALQNQFINTASDINSLGYSLLREQRNAEAIEVFKLNIEAYPNSANAFDSLAEAYLVSGNKDEAIKNYERAVGLNPNFASSLDALRKLKEKSTK